jgi:hypothetical protein
MRHEPLKKGIGATHQGTSKKVLFLGDDGAELHKANPSTAGGKDDGRLTTNTEAVPVDTAREVATRLHSAMQVDQKEDDADTGNVEKDETGKGKGGKLLGTGR